MSNRRLQPVRTIWAFLCLWLAACTTTVGEHPAPPDELSAVRGGGKVAVLLRFDGEDQSGRALKPLVSDGIHVPFTFLIGDADSGGVPTYEVLPEGAAGYAVAHQKYQGWALSIESRDEGWLTLFLRPGYYYLSLGGNCGLCPPSSSGLQFGAGGSVWRLEVPSGESSIYAGSFHLSGETSWDIGGRFFSGFYQQATEIRDESALAAQVARRDLPSLPLPVTRLIRRHAGPYLLGVPPASAN